MEDLELKVVSIISGTNRVPSNTRVMVTELKKQYTRLCKEEIKILDLSVLPLTMLLEKKSYSLGKLMPVEIKEAFELMQRSKLVHIVFPEYQGGVPGVLKFFIDHLAENIVPRLPAFALVSLGGYLGGAKALSQLYQILFGLGIFVHPKALSFSFSGEQLKRGVNLSQDKQKKLRDQISCILKFSEVHKIGLSQNNEK